MNSEKLSTIEGIIFELQTLRGAEDEVRKQMSQIIKYTPRWFSSLFVIGKIIERTIVPFILFFVGFGLGLHYDLVKREKPIIVKSNQNYCPKPESNLKSHSLIPPAGASTINGANTISQGFGQPKHTIKENVLNDYR